MGKPRRGSKPQAQGGFKQGGVRLQKILAQAGLCSRRQAEQWIQEGRVAVNGRRVTEQGVRIDPYGDTVLVDGKPLPRPEPIYLVMNKPDGVVCSAEGPIDDRERPTVLSLLPPQVGRVFPVGRLDYHSRGVLLLTNDGALSQALTHPRHKVPKIYHVKFQGSPTPETLEHLRSGVTLEDGVKTRPLEHLQVIKETETNVWVEMALRQGIYRQIRRMGDVVGHPVLKLIRVVFAGITADGVKEGRHRRLSDDEILHLKQWQKNAKASV